MLTGRCLLADISGERMGFGRKAGRRRNRLPALYGRRAGVGMNVYPSSCGEIGWAAVDRIATVLDCRPICGAPVFLTRFALDANGADVGVYARKRDFLYRTTGVSKARAGAELLPEVGPEPGDIVFVKKKPSAFLRHTALLPI